MSEVGSNNRCLLEDGTRELCTCDLEDITEYMEPSLA